jgi:ribosomal protein S12 methylthiotransferase accessory factor
MLKPYKEEKPLITINKIRTILNDLGIFVSEKFIQDGDYFTCRIVISNDNLMEFNIGTNGKGTSIEYAYASAYAEFMERLQNNFLINSFFFSKYYNKNCAFKKQLKLENKELDFVFCPDEKIVEVAKMIDENYEILGKFFLINDKDELTDFIINILKYKNAICVPFYNQKNNTTDYLPIVLLFYGTDSNGLCAGNTPEEALIQGISEILERYAIFEVYSNKITPPTIPHDYFMEYPIYNALKKLEEKGLELIIKDFSLGKGLPVIGVIVIDKNSRKYNVKIGSDPWPVIALERCLTEFHQSFFGIRLINKCDYGDFIEKVKYNGLDILDAENINLAKIIKNSTGQWPDSIFSDDFTYEFTGLNFNLGKSNKSDLKYLVQLIDELGSQLYIRDVSYLGFNSYYIVAPGLSHDKRNKSAYVLYNNLHVLINNINNTSILTKDELTSLLSLLEENYIAIKENYIDFEKLFFYNTDKEATGLTIDLFLSMASYKLGKIDKAYSYLKNYLNDKDLQDYLYFYGCKDYFALLKNGKNSYEIQSYMTKIYGSDLATEVIEDLQDANNIFKSYNLQSYFECNNCDINEFKYFKVADILKNIENKHKAQTIDQMNLSKIFYSN